MQTFEDFLQPLPPRPETGDPELDEALERIERVDDAEALAALRARTGAGPVLGARLEEVAATIGNLSLASKAERSLYESVYAAQHARLRIVEAVATAAAAHETTQGSLLRIFLEHPDPTVRLHVGKALLAARPSRPTLERMVPAMELEDGWMVWVRDVGTSAAVQLDPATAFDRLKPRVETELALPHSYLARGLFHALHQNAPIDARWFPFLVRFYEKQDAVVLDSVLRAHPTPEAVSALGAFVCERARAGQPWLTYAGFTLELWGPQGRAAAADVVEAVALALREGKSDYNLTKPLDVLVAMDERSVIPALQALQPLAKRKAKTVLEGALAKLGVAPAPTRKKTRAKIAPERAALARTLSDAGFSEQRVAELAKLAAPRIVLHPAAPDDTVKSYMGGLPSLPEGTPWPVARIPKRSAAEALAQGLEATPHTIEGAHVLVPLGFVAQLRLVELAPFDVDRVLPPAGTLAFFARQDVVLGDHGELQRIASAVLFFEDDERPRVPLAPPPELPDFEARSPKSVRFSGEIPLPEPQFAYKLGLLTEETQRYDALPREVPDFCMLGQAPAAYYQGLPGKRETLLLKVGSDDYTWGDASSVFFLIAKAALEARDFCRAVCVADEC